MIKKKIIESKTLYLKFSREKWATLRDDIPMTLSMHEIKKLRGINENLSVEDVMKIYLPLARLLNFYINSNLGHQLVIKKFLGKNRQKTPYIISIAGSVAVGKSTTARVLQALLSRWPEHRKVALITTDGFLHPNETLEKRGLMEKKGFPESYDLHRLVAFVSDLKSGIKILRAPVYSHIIYDVIPSKYTIIQEPDIVIIEGLNVLQNAQDYTDKSHHVFVSDFVDFSIYVDAPDELLEKWYVDRFLKFRQGAFANPNCYFYNYSQISELHATDIARTFWEETNLLNLKKNILPTRERANLIMKKSKYHIIETLHLRK